MSPDAWAVVGIVLGGLGMLAVALRSGRSTDQTTIFTAAQAMREESDRKLEAAWESRLAQKVEVIEELRGELTEALEKINALTAQVSRLQAQVESLGGTPHEHS